MHLLKLIFQLESNKHRTKTRNKKHATQKREIKTNIDVQRRWNHKNKRKKSRDNRKSLIQLEKKEKQFWWVILGQI